MGKNQKIEKQKYASAVIEPRISKYLRYFVLLVLFVSIAMLVWQVVDGLEDGVTVDGLLRENIYYFFFIFATLIYMSLPKLVQKKAGFVVDRRLVVVISIFIFAGTFLGQAFSFFDRFYWWDTMLHTISGIILGLIAFALTSALSASKKPALQLNPFYVALFSFTFAVAAGTLWEIGEYTMDWIFGTTMQCRDQYPPFFLTGNPAYQDAAIIDTMEDLIVDTIGALIVSVVGYFYLSRGAPFMATTQIRCPVPDSDSESDSKSDSESDSKSDSESDSKSDSESDSKSDSEFDSKSDDG